jgi:dTDP-4-dehydrorhamnose reductase
MKILLTGSNGILGKRLMIDALNKGYQIEGMNRKLYLTNNNDFLNKHISKFDIVIHAGANTNLEYCEMNPIICYQENVKNTETLVNAVRKNNKKLVYVSSTGVYGNSKIDYAYNEKDLANPTSVHHKSKFIAEELSAYFCPDVLIVRLGWLFGGDPYNNKNFIINRLKEIKQMKSTDVLFSDMDQIGNPTYVNDVSNVILNLLELNQAGIFNVVANDPINRFGYVRKICKAINKNIIIKQKPHSFFQRKAKVSLNESASNEKLLEKLGFELPSWHDRLVLYLNSKEILDYEKN